MKIIIKKSITAAQKCKKYMVAGSIEGFLSPANPKLKKKSTLSKLLHLQDHTEQNARIGGSRKLLLSSSELKYFSTEFSNKSLTLKVCKTINDIRIFVKKILESFSGRNIFLESPVFRFTNSLPYSLKEQRKFKILISWVLG